jgi:PAS domain S-box-containing protein
MANTSTKAEVEDLRARLREAEDTLEAIREGAVDALVVKDRNKQQIFTLKSADRTYRILIESMNQGAVTVTKDGTILYSNKQFSAMAGKPLEQIIGSQIQSLIQPDDQSKIATIMNQGSGGSELTIQLLREEYMAVMISATKLPDIENNAYMCLVVTDMTQLKRAEDAKDEFISLASHQLRTPATGVKQYLGMLLEGYAGDLTENQRVYTKTAYDSNERQLLIINNILKTAQLDFGAYEFKKSLQDMQQLLDNVLKDFNAMLVMRKQQIIYEVDKGITALVEPSEMSLVLANLIENASKYSSHGKTITIKISKTDKLIVIAVIDQGVGIALTDQKRIFDKFTRVDNDLSDTVSGSGLGLYWVKKIVELHNGSLDLQSEVNVGSTFTVRLPT